MVVKKYCGEDIAINYNRQIAGSSPVAYRDIDAMINFVVWIYNGSRIVKFAKDITGLTGYQSLTRIDAYNYVAKLTSANTVYLGEGDIYSNQDFITTDAGVTDLRANKKSGTLIFRLVKLPIYAIV